MRALDAVIPQGATGVCFRTTWPVPDEARGPEDQGVDKQAITDLPRECLRRALVDGFVVNVGGIEVPLGHQHAGDLVVTCVSPATRHRIARI